MADLPSNEELLESMIAFNITLDGFAIKFNIYLPSEVVLSSTESSAFYFCKLSHSFIKIQIDYIYI